MVFRTHAVNAAGFDQIVFGNIIGKYSAAVAITGQRFGRIKAGRGHVGNVAGALAVIFRTIALCGIRQNLHTVGMGDFHNFVIVGRVAENINRNNGLQIQFALFLNIGDCFFQIFRIHIERIGVGVDENRRSADNGNTFGRSDKRKGRNEHGIAGLNVPGHQSQRQRIGARTAGRAVFRTGIGCQLLVQFAAFRTLGITAVI